MGGDVVTSQYGGAGNPAGLLTVTLYNPAAHVVEGTVTATTVHRFGTATYGETANFLDGVLRADVQTQQQASSP